jgi:hypothetical protein
MRGLWWHFSSPGFLTGLTIFLLCYGFAWVRVKKPKEGFSYTFEPDRRPGSFEPVIARYTKLAEVIIGLATGSIVLLVGTNGLRNGINTKLPSSYGPPLVLLAMSVVFIVTFISLCSYTYEEWQHHKNYSHHKYRLNVALGFAGLFCFGIGYLWLAFVLVEH